ncbi:MAG: carboxypeptidase [Planctomycetes bacterium]|nr:carboxypeptidase [Planctomycetota bacterium]
MKAWTLLSSIVIASLICATLVAQTETPPVDAAKKKPEPEVEAKPAASQTTHQITIDCKVLSYTATAAWLIMKDDKDKPIARFGYTAYTKNGVDDVRRRPVTFAFNGGPGSSSIWLHMGILGPRRVVVTDAGYTPPPPSQCVDNAYTPLDVTDVVMIDPVGTGFSKPLGEAKGADFWGVDQDIKSVGAFIKRYVTENGRWASPKYILGESYGGVRSAGLVQYLQSAHGMNFNGVVLVSPFLSMFSGIDGVALDLPHVLYLPTFAATAWYHGALADKPASLEAYVAEVERFATDEYAPALMKGYTIPAAEKKAIAAKLGKYTGTSADYWEKADLRVSHPQFLQELKRSQRLIAGRIDSRFIGPSLNAHSDKMDYDPFFPSIGPAYTAAFLDYLHSELKFGNDEEYKVSAFDVKWDWHHKQPGLSEEDGRDMAMTNTVPDLAMAMKMNPSLNVLVQQGRFDLATPQFAMQHDLDHLDIPPEARQRIRIQYYEAGHMMYVNEPSAMVFRESLVKFIGDTDRL